MPKLIPTEDVRPLSEFRANASAFVQQVQETKRPVVLTQHGRSAAILLDVAAYEALVEQVELLRDIRTAESQIRKGHGRSHAKARTEILARMRR
jgi:antitoxin YefM